MQLVIFFIIFPLVLALAALLIRNARLRDVLVFLGVLSIISASLALLILNSHQEIVFFHLDLLYLDKIILALELILGGYIFIQGLKFKRPITILLVITQLILLILFEYFSGHKLKVEHNLFLDRLSIIMTMIIGLIGSIISIYAIGYMRNYQQHLGPEAKDKRNQFFFWIFLFFSAMFGIIFSNNLLWLYLCWEVTTLCSYALISYQKTDEAIKNGFKALEYNLLGGLLFLIAIIYFFNKAGNIELDKLMHMSKLSLLLPITLICCAGLIKAAQFPFSSWLLGAMVAPTPVSGLLHSSTMVKAGVYIILRFSSILEGTFCGFILAFIGGITFLIGSFIAITASDAKKILAYSTIANLGLIVLCAGVGTYEAAWAAMLLIIFHAIAKSLLFICVGTVDQKIKSRNVEDMAGLIVTMPKLSIMIQIGIAGMFLAPFGMLISKWAVLRALVDYNPILAIFVVFGSSATLFFWVKWIGKMITVVKPHIEDEDSISKTQWLALWILSFFNIAICSLFPVVSTILVQPYVMEIYHKTITMNRGNVMIMLIMLAMVLLFPLSFIRYGKRVKVVDAYLGAANIETNTKFKGALGLVKDMDMSNYYLEKYFGAKRLFKIGVWACGFLIIMILVSLLK